MKPKALWEIEVEALPSDRETNENGQQKRWSGCLRVASQYDDLYKYVNEWLSDHDMEATRHGFFQELRKAKGREGPGVVEVLKEEWIWKTPRSHYFD